MAPRRGCTVPPSTSAASSRAAHDAGEPGLMDSRDRADTDKVTVGTTRRTAGTGRAPISWLAQRSIRFSFLLVLAVVLATAAAAIVVVREQTRHDARRAALADARFAAQTGARELGSFVATVQTTVTQLAANPQIGQALTAPSGCTLTFAGLRAPDASHLDVVSRRGTVTCSSRHADVGHTVYGAAAWLPAALLRPQLRAPVVDPATGAHAAVVAAPIPGAKGVVVAFVDLDSAGSALARLYSGGHHDEFLVADGRTVLARSVAPRRWVGVRPASTWIARTAGTFQRADLDGTARLYAVSPVAGTGWHLFVGERTSEALAASARLQRRELAIIVAGLALTLLIAAITYRSLATPIRRLRDGLAARPDPSRPIAVAGPAELRDLTNDVNALVASVQRELEERKLAEERAAESERSYRLLFEANPNPMWVYDSETLRFLAVNDAAIHTYGYTRTEFLTMAIEDIRPPEERDRLHRLLKTSLPSDAHGLNLSGIWRHRRKDGSLFDAEITSEDHVFEGRPARIVMALDVTERYEAEQALRRSEARYRDLFENATDMIATLDLEGRLTNVNRAFAHTLGYDADELAGRPLASIVHGGWDDEPDVGGEPHAHLSVRELIAKDGRSVPVEVASRVVYEDGRATGIEAICRDVTERQQLEEQLRQAQRLEAVGRLAGGIAHDFNNLLTVIGGYAELLIRRSDESPPPPLVEISAAADRAKALTRQLLAFSRRQVLQPRVVDVNEIVGGLTPMLQRLIGEDVELEAAFDPAAGRVLADPTQIEQVVVNLVVNARDAMPTGGKLTISTSFAELDQAYVDRHPEAITGPHAVLAVSDTGTGMDAATLTRVFEPFFTTKPAGVGTGLGLSTVYGIVKQSNGTIWAYSEPGRGTTFKVYLPWTSVDVTATEFPRDETPVPTGTETILVVEDELPVRDLVFETLSELGYNVLTAKSGEEALAIADERDDVDLVLTDLVMPQLSGRELATRIRDRRPGIRLLFMSGYADEAVSRNGALEPGAAFVEKPFTSKSLSVAVRRALDQPQGQPSPKTPAAASAPTRTTPAS
jgi:two-component system, cell cycle sensor histidine kinase and response regulator CckA